MKFMLLMWSDGTYAGGEPEEDYAVWQEYTASLETDGVLVGSGVFDPDATVTVTTDLTAPAGDSAAAPAGGILAGYYLLDCESAEAAAAHARRAPLYGSVVVHPLEAY